MNLPLAHRIITEAEGQPFGFLKVRGRDLAREVHLMAEAGLVKATETGDVEPTEAVITRVTHAGHQFYRALKNVRAYATSWGELQPLAQRSRRLGEIAVTVARSA